MAWNRKLGRTSSQRKAMLRNLATDVIVRGRITTTVTRAKEVQSVVEELITLGKKNNLHAIRQASSYVRPVVVDKSTNKTALQVLFNDVAPRYTGVNGGYTRILRVGARKGDNAEMAIIELV